MTAIMISYDLHTPGQKYSALIEKIKGYANWANPLASTWLVSGFGLTAQTVTDNLRTVLDGNDLIFCVDVTNDPNAGWLPQDMWDWIAKNV